MSGDPGIDWAAEAQTAVDGLVRDVIRYGADQAGRMIHDRMLPATIEPEVAACMCVEAAGLAIVTVMTAAGMLGRDPVEFLDLIQRWRGVTTTAGNP